jgi:hypothetical protein
MKQVGKRKKDENVSSVTFWERREWDRELLEKKWLASHCLPKT